MASNPVQGRYILYKAGTTKLVQWLATAASRCCDISSIIKSRKPQPTKPRSERDKSAKIQLLRTADLLRLAETITSANSPVTVSADILEVAREVISGRKLCADWYSAQAVDQNSKLAQQDHTHQYFIEVLQRVYGLLDTAHKQQQQAQHDVSAPSSNKRGKSHKKPSTLDGLEFQLEDSSEDTAFALWCFLQDLDDARSFIREIWTEYTKGDVSFLAASIVTDTAFGLMRCADEDLVSLYPKFIDYFEVLDFLGMTVFLQGHSVWLMPIDPQVGAKKPEATVNVADLMCPSAALLLRGFLQRQTLLLKNTYKRKHGQPEEPEPQDVLSQYAYHEFGPILLGLGRELFDHAMLQPEKGDRFGDEFVRGLGQFSENADTRIWLVVACQAYMDIYDLVGSNPACGAELLRRSLLRDNETIAETENYRQKLAGAPELPNLGELQRLASRNNSLASKLGSAAVADEAEAVTSNPQLEPFIMDKLMFAKICRKLPLSAGDTLYFSRVRLHSWGTFVSNSGLPIHALAYMYKAARHYGLITTDWYDMDFVLANQSSRAIFTKLAPTADEDAMVRHWRMALGIPVTQAARTKKFVRPDCRVFTQNARFISVTSDFMNEMIQRYGERHNLGVSNRNTIAVVLQSLTAKASEASQKAGGARKDKAATSAVKFTPLQLLQTFKSSIIADEPQLNFDYLGFWRECMANQNKIIERLLPRISKSIGRIAGGDFEVIDAILCQAADLTRASKSLSNTWIADAAETLRSIISEDGKKFTQPAFDQSSGRIPKHLRPTYQKRTGCCEKSHELLSAFMPNGGYQVGTAKRNAATYDPSGSIEKLVYRQVELSAFQDWLNTGLDMDNVPQVLLEKWDNGKRDVMHRLHQVRSFTLRLRSEYSDEDGPKCTAACCDTLQHQNITMVSKAGMHAIKVDQQALRNGKSVDDAYEMTHDSGGLSKSDLMCILGKQ